MAAMLKVIAEENKKGKIDISLAEIAKTCGVSVEAIKKGAKDFNAAASGTVVFVPERTKERNDLISYFVKVLASFSPNKKSITFYGFGNTLGVNTMLDRMLEGRTSYPDMLKKIENGQLKALLMLGEDILASHPERERKIRSLKFMAASNYFTTTLVDEAVLLLPLASHLESAGNYILADGRMENLEALAPKIGAKTNLEIIASLMNIDIEPEKIMQETKEILERGRPQPKVDLNEKLSEAKKNNT